MGNKVLLLSLIAFLTFSSSLLRPLALLFAREELNAGLGEIGIRASIPGAASVALAALFGFMSDKKQRAPIFSLGAIITGLSMIMIAFSIIPLHVLLAAGLAGIATATFDPVLFAAVGDMSSAEGMGKAYGFLTFSANAGLGAGPAIGGYLTKSSGYRFSFIVAGVLGLLAGGAATPLLRGKNKLIRTEGPKEGRKIERNALIGWLSSFFVFFATGGIQVFLPLYTKDIGLGEAFIGILISIMLIVGAIARILSGVFLDRLGKEALFAVIGLVIVSLPASLLVPFSNPATLLLLMSLIGLGFGMTGLAGNVIIAKETSEVNRGLAMGFAATSRFGGLTLGPASAAAILGFFGDDPFGFQIVFSTMSAIALFGALLVYGIGKRHVTVIFENSAQK